MNERIRNLMRGSWQASEGSPPEGHEDFREELMDEMQGIFNKFAELIVKECMTVIKADPEDGDTINCIANLAILKLEKHFGVES